MGTELTQLDQNQIKALVANQPLDRRAALSKGLRAACQHVKDKTGNYSKAYPYAEAMIENWWMLGNELRRLKDAGVLRNGRPKKNDTPGDNFSLGDLGLTLNQSARAQRLAGMSKAELDEWLQEQYDEINCTFPTLKHLVRERKKAERQAAEGVAGKTVRLKDAKLTGKQDAIECAVVITDPPYGILEEEWEPADLESFTREWLTRWRKCGADFFLVFWSQRHLWEGRRWFDESLSGYHFQQLLVWHYRNNKSPQSREGFKQTWEPIFFYRRTDATRKILISEDDWGEDHHDFDCHVAAVPQSNFDGENAKAHPAQKPVSVMRWLINATTEPGELVADPFMGSGTTGIAAAQLGRRFHGIEINQEYRKLAKGRISLYGESV